ncbi:MAG: ATP-binding cassette domain-containing protein, partial [Bacteroidota bacterium]
MTLFISSGGYLTEIAASVQHGDYSLASRRILDYLYDTNLNSHEQFKTLSFDIRKNYLQQSQSDVIDQDSLKQQCEQWLALSAQIPVADKEEHMTGGVYHAENLSKEYVSRSRNFKLEPVSLEIKLGELTAVVGENGNGKTTLLRLIAGELSQTSGTVAYFEQPGLEWYDIKGKIAYIPQRPNRWYGTLIDNLHFFCSINDIKGEENEDHVNYILHRLGLFQFRHLKWTEISSGYRLRFELAKALMMRPKLLVLDE